MAIEFEDILEEVDGYGKFQKVIVNGIALPASHALPFFWCIVVLMLYVPDHWCHIPETQNISFSNLSRNGSVGFAHDPHCSKPNFKYEASHFVENFTNHASDSCSDGWEYDTTDFTRTASTQWDLVCEKSYYPSLILTLQNVGGLIGTPIYGFLSDRFGRKSTYCLIVAVIFITELLPVVIDNLILFAVMKLLNGGVLKAHMTLHCVLLMEFVCPEKRGLVTGLINAGWSVGLCFVPLVAYLGKDWILLGYVNAAMSFMIFLAYLKFVPESPSWLISRDRYEEAASIMHDIGKQNGKEIEKSTILKKIQKLGADNKKKSEAGGSHEGKWAILKSTRIMKNVFMITACYIGNNVAYIGLLYNVGNLYGNLFLNFFLMSIGELPGCLILWYLMDTYGRRWSACFGFIATGLVSMLAVIGFPYSDVVSAMLGKMIIAGVFMITDQQACELFPTVARTTLMNLTKTIALLATIFLPYITSLNIYGREVPFILVAVVCLASGILSSLLPETLNENLPQTILDAENFGLDQRYFSWGNKRKKQDNVDEDTRC